MRSLKIEDIPTLTPTEREAILLLKERLRQNFNLVKMILYGSKARGDHHDHSDVDLMVLVEEPKTWENREKLSDLQFEVIMQHDAPLMSILENNQKWQNEQEISLPLKDSIESEGVEIEI